MTKWLPVWLGELALQGLKMHDCFKTIGFRAGLVNYALGQWSRNSQFETKMVHRGFARFSPEIAGRARAQTRSVTGASMLTEAEMKSLEPLGTTQEMLRFVIGGTAVAAGADKFFNLLTDWEQYLSPVARRRIPMEPENFMRLVGVIEMAVGGTILAGRSRVGGYIAGAWLLGIAANLIANRDYDIAARDVNMAVGAFVLARMSEAKGRARQPERALEEVA